jgi:hypothetical protein
MSIARCSKTARVAGVAAWRARGKGSAEWQVWQRYKNISPGPLRRRVPVEGPCHDLQGSNLETRARLALSPDRQAQRCFRHR